jgi:hypothetical protein
MLSYNPLYYITCITIVPFFQKESDTNKANSKKDSQKSVPGDIKGEKAEEEPRSEMTLGEYYITNHYKSVQESLALFKDDPLVHKPGLFCQFNCNVAPGRWRR